MKTKIILILLFYIPISLFGQKESVDASKFNLGFKLGYFYPIIYTKKRSLNLGRDCLIYCNFWFFILNHFREELD